MLFSSNDEIKTTIEPVINQHATLSMGLLLRDIDRHQSVAENHINRICVINLMQMYVSQPRSDRAIIGKFDCMSKYLIIRMLNARIDQCYKHFHILNEQQ